jgi:phosphoglycolate phosphatase
MSRRIEDGLLLWDIDHTLIDISRFRERAYRDIFMSLTGLPFRGLASTPGRTTFDKIRETLLLHGVTPTTSLVDIAAELLTHTYESTVDLTKEARLLPGAEAILRYFSSTGSFRQTVVTGNLRRIALAKVNAFGISRYLDVTVGAYGDDGVPRDALVPIALERYLNVRGELPSRHMIFVLGDTIHDMMAARSIGVRAIGVGTGRFSTFELATAGAELVVDDLTDVEKIRQFIFMLRRMLGPSRVINRESDAGRERHPHLPLIGCGAFTRKNLQAGRVAGGTGVRSAQ